MNEQIYTFLEWKQREKFNISNNNYKLIQQGKINST